MSEFDEGWLGTLEYMDKLHMPEIYHWCRVVQDKINVLFHLLGFTIALSTSHVYKNLGSWLLVLMDPSLSHTVISNKNTLWVCQPCYVPLIVLLITTSWVYLLGFVCLFICLLCFAFIFSFCLEKVPWVQDTLFLVWFCLLTFISVMADSSILERIHMPDGNSLDRPSRQVTWMVDLRRGRARRVPAKPRRACTNEIISMWWLPQNPCPLYAHSPFLETITQTHHPEHINSVLHSQEALLFIISRAHSKVKTDIGIFSNFGRNIRRNFLGLWWFIVCVNWTGSQSAWTFS